MTKATIGWSGTQKSALARLSKKSSRTVCEQFADTFFYLIKQHLFMFICIFLASFLANSSRTVREHFSLGRWNKIFFCLSPSLKSVREQSVNTFLYLIKQHLFMFSVSFSQVCSRTFREQFANSSFREDGMMEQNLFFSLSFQIGSRAVREQFANTFFCKKSKSIYPCFFVSFSQVCSRTVREQFFQRRWNNGIKYF